MEKTKKEKIYISIGIIALMITLTAATYAYFIPEIGGNTTQDVSVTSNTTDNLSFQLSGDISFTASTQNFYQNGQNISGESTLTAILTPNNKTYYAEDYYSLFLNMVSNPTVYSSTNTNHDPELLLQVFDSNNNLVSIPWLGEQKNVGSLTGYDITGVTGNITLLNVKRIIAEDTVTTQTYRVVVTMINLGVDQNDNTGKVITGQLVVEREQNAMPDNSVITTFANNYGVEPGNNIILNDSAVYYHDEDLEDGAADYSYRYSGENPDNFVCFGSTATPCPADNLYRIIGVIPTVVAVDETRVPIKTQRQSLYKLLKYEYLSESDLGLTKVGYAAKYSSSKNPSYDVDGFIWEKVDYDYSSWQNTSLKSALNTTFYNSLGSTWQNKIANVMWKVGRTNEMQVYQTSPMSDVYYSELGDPFEEYDPSSDLQTIAKIGLIYASDMGYSTPMEDWNVVFDSYYYVDEEVWACRKVQEWTITNSLYIATFCGVYEPRDDEPTGVRPVFYLKNNVEIDMDNYAGTISDPFRIVLD